MRSRRVLVGGAALVLAGLGIAPAQAADVVVQVRDLQADNPVTFALQCDGGLDFTGIQPAYRIRSADPAPVLGDVSWGLMNLGGVAGQFGPGVATSDAAQVENQSLHVYGAGSGVAEVYTGIPDATAPNGEDVWIGTAVIDGGSVATPAWTTVSVTPSTSYSWQQLDTSAYPPTRTGSPESATFEAFMTAHGTPEGSYAGFDFGCDLAAQTAYFYDDLQVGASGATTTYDFERVSSTAVMGAAPAPITAGGTARIHLQSASSRSVVLQAKAYGSSTWRTVATVDSSTTTAVSVKPVRQTSYRWFIAAADCCLSDTSSTVTVKVRTAVTLRLADSTIRKGQSLVASGVTKPHKPGVAVTLWRKTTTGASLLASSRVHADGTYKISYRVPRKGTWKVFVKVAGASGNLAGTSPVRTATVS